MWSKLSRRKSVSFASWTRPWKPCGRRSRPRPQLKWVTQDCDMLKTILQRRVPPSPVLKTIEGDAVEPLVEPLAVPAALQSPASPRSPLSNYRLTDYTSSVAVRASFDNGAKPKGRDSPYRSRPTSPSRPRNPDNGGAKGASTEDCFYAEQAKEHPQDCSKVVRPPTPKSGKGHAKSVKNLRERAATIENNLQEDPQSEYPTVWRVPKSAEV